MLPCTLCSVLLLRIHELVLCSVVVVVVVVVVKASSDNIVSFARVSMQAFPFVEAHRNRRILVSPLDLSCFINRGHAIKRRCALLEKRSCAYQGMTCVCCVACHSHWAEAVKKEYAFGDESPPKHVNWHQIWRQGKCTTRTHITTSALGTVLTWLFCL